MLPCAFSLSSKAGICEMFEGHQGPVTGISCHSAVGTVDFSHLFITSSFDWTVKLWSTKVQCGRCVLVCVRERERGDVEKERLCGGLICDLQEVFKQILRGRENELVKREG